jgi:subtilisin family serine protease
VPSAAGLADLDALTVDPSSYNPSRILVRFRPEADAGASLNGTTVGPELSLIDGLHEVRLSPDVTVAEALTAYRASPFVLYAQPDYRLRLTAAVTPNDVSFATMWGLDNTGQNGGTLDADVDAPEAWTVTTGSGRTVVAVIDTGIDYTHPDLAANIWTNPGEVPANGRDDDGNGYVDDVHGYDFVNNDSDPIDDNGHGTHVAGTIGAVGNNGVGVTGINWNVRLMALKFIDAGGSGFTSDAVRALDYAVANGAHISNNSWGGGGYNSTLYSAIQNARAAGHIFVAAAGNDGANNDQVPTFPAGYDLDNVVAVAATNRNDQLTTFSNYGAATVDLAAPGGSILSTLPGNTYNRLSGTSMAAPHVAGVLALVRDLHPEWTYRQVIDRVLGTVDPLPALQGKTVTGGRLNAARAVGYSGPLDTGVPSPTPGPTPTPDPEPAPSPEVAYVHGLYRDVLGRAPDTTGLSVWVRHLQAGASREAVARAVWESAEHRGLQVDQYYATFLDRAAEPAGRAQWVKSFLIGASELDIMRGFLTSGEYRAAHVSNVSFVVGLFHDVLGRDPDAFGQAAWQQALANGASREAVAQAVLTSAEAHQRAIDAFYAAFLHRPTDGSGQQHWMELLQSGRANLESVATAILASNEYLATAQGGKGTTG